MDPSLRCCRIALRLWNGYHMYTYLSTNLQIRYVDAISSNNPIYWFNFQRGRYRSCLPCARDDAKSFIITSRQLLSEQIPTEVKRRLWCHTMWHEYISVEEQRDLLSGRDQNTVVRLMQSFTRAFIQLSGNHNMHNLHHCDTKELGECKEWRHRVACSTDGHDVQ